MFKVTRIFLADLWALTKPYWFSEERWAARGLLAVVVALNLGTVYVNVLFNRWNNDFYNALQNMDQAAFIQQLWKFSWIAAASRSLILRNLALSPAFFASEKTSVIRISSRSSASSSAIASRLRTKATRMATRRSSGKRSTALALAAVAKRARA